MAMEPGGVARALAIEREVRAVVPDHDRARAALDPGGLARILAHRGGRGGMIGRPQRTLRKQMQESVNSSS